MHEVSLAQQMVSTLEDVARNNGARRVLAATIRIGELSCVEPESLRFAFEIVSKETLLQGCTLIIEKVPLVVRCSTCGHEGPGGKDLLGCPACKAESVTVVSGREIQLKSIEVEDDEDA